MPSSVKQKSIISQIIPREKSVPSRLKPIEFLSLDTLSDSPLINASRITLIRVCSIVSDLTHLWTQTPTFDRFCSTREEKHPAGTADRSPLRAFASEHNSRARRRRSLMIYRQRSLVNYSSPRCRVHDLRNAAERPPKKNTTRKR